MPTNSGMRMKLHKCFLLVALLGVILFTVVQCSIIKPKVSVDKTLKEFKYTTLDAKCSALFNDAFHEQSFNVNFRIEKNKFIWASLTGPLSIEGARILIKPDSVILIDRLSKAVYSGSYLAFQVKYNIPLSFEQIQKIIVGDIQSEITTDSNCVLQDDLRVCTIKNERAIFTYFLHPKNYTLEKMRVKDRYGVRELTANFAGYQIINGKEFSFNKVFEINTKNELAKLQLEFDKVIFDETIECNFSIPESYERRSF